MGKDLVEVANFTIENCSYKIYQPNGELSEEDYEQFHEDLAKILYK